MFTKDQLNQLRELIREENEPIKKTQQEHKSDYEAYKWYLPESEKT